MNAAIVLDLAALAVLALCAFLYYRRGFLAGVFRFAGNLLALLAAVIAANIAAPHLFDGLFRTGLEKRTTDLILSQDFSSLEHLLGNLLSFLPKDVLRAIGAQYGDSIDLAAPGVARQVVDGVVAPIVTPLILIVVFLLLFIVLHLLLGLLVKVLSNLNRLPVIGGANQVLGLGMGLLIGLLYVFLICCVLWGLSAATGGMLAENYVGHSIVYRLFSGLDFFR